LIRRLAALLLVAPLLACDPVDGTRPDSTASEASRVHADRATDPRPSVLLVVFDTLRADAVSAYGSVDGTTPTIDRLARGGLRYTRAFAPSPWTVSSHVSLFTGLRVDEHGVGLDGAFVASDSLQMLAEDFQEAGYVTAGFSENALVSRHFGFDQGFDDFESLDIVARRRSEILGEAAPAPFDLVESVRRWNRARDPSEPYFLFVNLFGPHDPYVPRETNPWVPKETNRVELEFIQSTHPIPNALCGRLPSGFDREVLHGLYLGDVHESDRQLAELIGILDAAPDAGVDGRLVVVTSDHGEHFGEHRLMGHQFSVWHPALHVPLVVSGLPGVPPAVVGSPVELRALGLSIRCWALGDACPAELPRGRTPEEEVAKPAEPIFSLYSDSVSRLPDWLVEQFGDPTLMEAVDPARLKCTPEDRVFGEMVSMIRYPMKMIWFSEGEPVLHDLSWDPDERLDQTENQPELAASMRAELEAFVRRQVTGRERAPAEGLSEEGARALKSLGYVD
jgi:hypothetical protein